MMAKKTIEESCGSEGSLGAAGDSARDQLTIP